MKKKHENWLIESGWKIIRKSGYGGQRVCHLRLEDRIVVSFAEIDELPNELSFTHGAGINFEEFLRVSGKITKKRSSGNTYRIHDMNVPYAFYSSSNPSVKFIQDATATIQNWAVSLDLKEIVEDHTHLKNEEGEDRWHGSIITHLGCLTILGKTDILEKHLADTKTYAGQPKTPHINMMGEPHIYIERAIDLSKDYAKNPFFK